MTPSERTRPSHRAWPSRPCSLPRTLSRARIPGPSPLRSLPRPGQPGPLSRSGAAMLRPASVPAVHRRLLIERSLQSQPVSPASTAPLVLISAVTAARVRPTGSDATGPRSGLRQVSGKPVIGEHSGRAKRSRKRPAAPRLLQTTQVGVQICPPAWVARRGVGDEFAVDRHYAEQVRLGGANLASHAGTDHRPGHGERQEHTARPKAYRPDASAAPGTLSAIGLPNSPARAPDCPWPARRPP